MAHNVTSHRKHFIILFEDILVILQNIYINIYSGSLSWALWTEFNGTCWWWVLCYAQTVKLWDSWCHILHAAHSNGDSLLLRGRSGCRGNCHAIRDKGRSGDRA
ncbi:hypothetical protein LDENG_00273590 [Lucifuga dentata]|nr:hypothetical protein LDENG_00273590 [Lucifuga dentata]